MERKSRIHQIIEAELRKHLSFSISMEENLSNPGSPVFKSGDDVRFRVWVRNRADVRFNRVAGLLMATVSSSFPTTRFEIRDLEPWQEKPVAVLRAQVLSDPRPGNGTGSLVKLTMVAAIDLPEIEISDSERFLGVRATRDRRTPGSKLRSIPLSDAPSYPAGRTGQERKKHRWS